MNEESSEILRLVLESTNLVGYVGDNLTYAGEPVTFTPSKELFHCIKHDFQLEASSTRKDAHYFQLALDNLISTQSGLIVSEERSIELMACQLCGTSNPKDAKYCMQCGDLIP